MRMIIHNDHFGRLGKFDLSCQLFGSYICSVFAFLAKLWFFISLFCRVRGACKLDKPSLGSLGAHTVIFGSLEIFRIKMFRIVFNSGCARVRFMVSVWPAGEQAYFAFSGNIFGESFW